MKESLLKYLSCIYCGAVFSLLADEREGREIIRGTLTCTECDRHFPVIGGVPRIITDLLDKDKVKTAEGFGYEWKSFAEISEIYERQFLDWIYPVRKDFFQGKFVLDAGCGKGRHILCTQKFGAREIIGVDLSEAVEAAFTNTRHLPNVHVVQADIYQLPFNNGIFDYVYSIGVLHHLPRPDEGFRELLPYLKSGGQISIWVYGEENNGWIIKFVNPLRKRVTAKMSLPLLKYLCGILSLFLYGTLKVVYKPINSYRRPLAGYLFYNDYLSYISKFSFREIHSIVFDHLLAPVAYYHPKEEVGKWFSDASLKDISISWHNGNSWCALGSKV